MERKIKWFIILCVAMGFASMGSADKGAKGPKTEKATFAGGCFWCMQPPFDRLKGVLSTIVGYTGGQKKDPTYDDVSAGGTGHAEAIEITYDPAQVGYSEILDVFWKNIDPTTPNQQFCDHGDQYRSEIYCHGEEQKKLAIVSKEKMDKSGKFSGPIVTQIVPASIFYPAEDYHQSYYKKNPLRYKYYRYNCGRDQYLEKIWGKSDH